MIKQQHILKISSLNVNAVFVKVIVHNIFWQPGLKNEKKIADDKGFFGALLTDLSFVFNWLQHVLIFDKLETYVFQVDTLKLIHDYLSNRKQKVKVVRRRRYFMVSHKHPNSVLYESAYIYVTCSTFGRLRHNKLCR